MGDRGGGRWDGGTACRGVARSAMTGGTGHGGEEFGVRSSEMGDGRWKIGKRLPIPCVLQAKLHPTALSNLVGTRGRREKEEVRNKNWGEERERNSWPHPSTAHIGPQLSDHVPPAPISGLRSPSSQLRASEPPPLLPSVKLADPGLMHSIFPPCGHRHLMRESPE